MRKVSTCNGCISFRRIDVPEGFRGSCGHPLRKSNSFLQAGKSHSMRTNCKDYTNGEGIRIRRLLLEHGDLELLRTAESNWGADSVEFRDLVLGTAESYKEKENE